MQKKNLLIMSAAALLMLTSCSKLGELSADNFKVVPNPLQAEAGQVAATINGTFPEKFMAKKAVVTVTPELRYADGKVARGTAATFQGEKVSGNDQTISYKVGGNYTMKSTFNYVPEMQKSELYLVFDAKIGNKVKTLPAIKVADGVIATSELYRKASAVTTANQACVAQDTYQRIIAQKQEANIKFLIQQANLRKSELKNNSVTEFIKLLDRINNDKENLALKNVEISAYASPDGGVKLNDKLAGQRQANTEKYLAKELKKIKMDATVDANYTAQDWEGFQELVKASNIQDKDVIIRVLSMYKDPEQREQQIKNMGAAFEELKDGILPQLRRARLTINYDVIGRSDAQIMEQYKADASKLSLEEVLYAATLTSNVKEQADIYTTATKLYPNDARAYNNLATIEYAKGNDAAAKNYLNKAIKLDGKQAEANANLGLLALKAGNVNEAQNHVAKAGNANGVQHVLGNLNIAKGNYAQAEKDLANTPSNAAALAQIMNKNYAAAATTLANVPNADGTTEYLKAILAARQGNNDAARTALAKAIAKDPSWASYAANDLELKNIAK